MNKKSLQAKIVRELNHFMGDDEMARQRKADAADILLRTQNLLWKATDESLEEGYLQMAVRNLKTIKRTKR